MDTFEVPDPSGRKATIMTTYGDHLGAADDAYEAARSLAHATIRFDRPTDSYDGNPQRPEHPEDTHSVIGDVLAVLRCLHQVVQQVDACQHRSVARATGTDREPATGRDLTATAHGHLRDAILALDQAHARLDLALGATSAIAWQPAPTPETGRRAGHDVASLSPLGRDLGGASGLGL